MPSLGFRPAFQYLMAAYHHFISFITATAAFTDQLNEKEVTLINLKLEAVSRSQITQRQPLYF